MSEYIMQCTTDMDGIDCYVHTGVLIRCKDCKYSVMTDDGECKYCDIWFPDEAEYMDGDYYCGSAERKEDGETDDRT